MDVLLHLCLHRTLLTPVQDDSDTMSRVVPPNDHPHDATRVDRGYLRLPMSLGKHADTHLTPSVRPPLLFRH